MAGIFALAMVLHRRPPHVGQRRVRVVGSGTCSPRSRAVSSPITMAHSARARRRYLPSMPRAASPAASANVTTARGESLRSVEPAVCGRTDEEARRTAPRSCRRRQELAASRRSETAPSTGPPARLPQARPENGLVLAAEQVRALQPASGRDGVRRDTGVRGVALGGVLRENRRGVGRGDDGKILLAGRDHGHCHAQRRRRRPGEHARHDRVLLKVRVCRRAGYRVDAFLGAGRRARADQIPRDMMARQAPVLLQFLLGAGQRVAVHDGPEGEPQFGASTPAPGIRVPRRSAR